MAIEIEGQRYEIVIGTDVSRPSARNGAFLEMRALDRPHEGIILIAFRSNASGKITISAYRQDIPLEILDRFLRIAAEELSTTHWPLWVDET
ncbi:hypothetical protein [Gemmata sp.]|uniref:hypothetical protein n=1 Tax=Gemmata sp. TaxID=1914242 RepID=UPI003F721480